jgi:glycerol-3-phosphate dehydrogenase (NAD(P)+)
MRIGVIGAGGWGTTLAQVYAERGHDVTLWARSQERAEEISRLHENPTYLPGIRLHPSLEITHASDELANQELYLFALPGQATREVAAQLAAHLSTKAAFVSASKGIERGSLARVTEVLSSALNVDKSQVLSLSGPSHAEEVARKIPTAIVIAGYDHALTREVQIATSLPTFRVYSSSDVVGVELAGALKNVIAICAGIIDGVGYGDNTKAALITRGLAEMRRLGIALGADEHTFAGLAGLGDLVVTCESQHSRNRFVGQEIGRGRKLAEITSSMNMIAEGVATTESGRALAAKHHIEMPIIEETFQVLFAGKDPRTATMDLMTRDPKNERW